MRNALIGYVLCAAVAQAAGASLALSADDAARALVIYPREYWRLENDEKIVGEGGQLETIDDSAGQELEVVLYSPPRSLQRERAIPLFTTVKPKEPAPKLLERKYQVWRGPAYADAIFKEPEEPDRTIYRRGSEAHDARIGALYETALLGTGIAKLRWALDQAEAAKLGTSSTLPPTTVFAHPDQNYLDLRMWLLGWQQALWTTRGLIYNVEQIGVLRQELTACQAELPKAKERQQALLAELTALEEKLKGRTAPKGDPDRRRRDIALMEEYEARADILWNEKRIAQLEERVKKIAIYVATQFKTELNIDPAMDAAGVENAFAVPTAAQIEQFLTVLTRRRDEQIAQLAELADVPTVLAAAAAELEKLAAAAANSADPTAEPVKKFLADYAAAYHELSPAKEMAKLLAAWSKAVEKLPTVDFGRYRISLSAKIEGIPNALGTPINVQIGGMDRTFYSYEWPDTENFHDILFNIELRESDDWRLAYERPAAQANINAYCASLDEYNAVRLKGWQFAAETTLSRMAGKMFAGDAPPTDTARDFVLDQYKAHGTLDVSISLGRTRRNEQRGMGSPDASLDTIRLDRIRIERYDEPKLVLRQTLVQKNLVKPGEGNQAMAWIHNRTANAQTGELRIFHIKGLGDYKLLSKVPVTLEPQSFVRLVYPIPSAADDELFGHEVRIELVCDDRRTVATDVFAVHTNCFHVFMLGGASGDSAYRGPKDYCNHRENFGVTYNDSVEGLPEKVLVPYVRGMPTAPALGHIPLCRAETQRNRALGVASVQYLSPLCTGERSYFHYLRNPEWWPTRLAWTDQMNDSYLGGIKLLEEAYNAGQPIDRDAIRKQYPMLHLEQPVNHANKELFDNLVEDLITYRYLVGWAGTRWDGGPISVFTHDFLGRPVKHLHTGKVLESDADVRQTSAELFRELKTRMRAHHPDWVYGNNGDAEGFSGALTTLERDAPDSKDFPQYREFMSSGGSMMDEGWMSAYIFIDARNRVEDYLKICFKESMEMKRHGGILQTFAPERETTPTFHVDKIYYTLLPHLCGATYYGELSTTPWSNDGPACFFTRFGEFFFDPALRPYPEAENAIHVDAPDTWNHEIATWKQLGDDHVQVIVPIVNKHPRERIYDNLNRYSELPVPVADDFAVSVQAPAGFEQVKPTVWQLTCEPKTRAVELPAEMSSGVVEFQVPGLKLFKVVVLDYQRRRS